MAPQAESIRDTPSLTQYFLTTRPGKTPQPQFDKRLHKTKRRSKHKAQPNNLPTNRRLPHYCNTNSRATNSDLPTNQHPRVHRSSAALQSLNNLENQTTLILNPYLQMTQQTSGSSHLALLAQHNQDRWSHRGPQLAALLSMVRRVPSSL
jgi:hypothetical protein